MSAPSLMVLDNRRATLQIGDQVPIVTQQAQAVVAGTVGPIVNSVTLKDTGVILTVTPHVNENGTIQLEVEQEVSSATRTQTSGIDSPTIQQRRVRTNVIVRDGDVVTLGGMIQERDTANKSQVPILGDLPVVGLAFRQKGDKVERTELLIFLRPLVVRNEVDAQSVTEEFRQRLNIERPTTTKGRNIYDRDARRILH
jgi:general secretion pathway protein D